MAIYEREKSAGTVLPASSVLCGTMSNARKERLKVVRKSDTSNRAKGIGSPGSNVFWQCRLQWTQLA